MLIVVLIVIMFKEGEKNKKEFDEQQASAEQATMQDPLEAPVNLNPMLKSENDYTFVQSSDNGGEVGETDKEGCIGNENSAEYAYSSSFTISEESEDRSAGNENTQDKTADSDCGGEANK